MIESGENSLSRCMTSVLLMTRKFVMPDSKVSFDYRVDSRDCARPGYLGCDGLGFFIDNQQVLDYSGNQFQWNTKMYNLTTVSEISTVYNIITHGQSSMSHGLPSVFFFLVSHLCMQIYAAPC